MRRILCIQLPNWPVQRLLAARRELDPRRPLLLHARDARQRQLVAACNAAAAQHGVRLLMPLPEADALVAPREEPYILPWDEAADLAALAHLAERCERFSPLVGWQTTSQNDARRGPDRFSSPPRLSAPERASATFDYLLLDVTGIGILFGDEESLARAVLSELKGLRYNACVAVADTVGAAWALAVAQEKMQQEKMPACVVLPPGSSAAALAPLPLSCLRLPAETLALFAQLGITQIEQLLKLPRTSLTARFGERLLWRLDQLQGTAQETIVAHRPPPEFVAERCLEYPAESRTLVEHVLRELVREIAPALAQRQMGAVEVTCRLDAAPGRPVVLRVGLFRPSADPHHLWDLLRMQLEQTALPGPVGRLTLAAPLTAPLENRQRELFAASRDEAVRQGELLIDRLSSRLGAEAVLRPELTADPLPERATRVAPAVGHRKRRSDSSPRHAPTHRPLLVCSPPVALEVMAIAPDGPPASFRWSGEQHVVAHYWGPERIESGWWRGPSVRRDYYRVETKSGQRYWLFRRLPGGQWYLHGEFG
jgi:protein ImuB